MPFCFNTLLTDAGIAPADVRLLRHQPKIEQRWLTDIWRSDRALYEDYQSLQLRAKRSHFTRPYWASFIGTWDGRTIFAGLYEVGAPETLTHSTVAPITGSIEPAETVDRYPVRHLNALDAYEGRLFVEWGGGTSGRRAWVQRAELQNKQITELHMEHERPFPGVMHIVQPLSAMSYAPPGWIAALSAARGVYLLTCPRDGSQYVGSAISSAGFWGRWSDYRANGHGGNVALVAREPSDFIVSVLQVAGSTETADDIVAAEHLWMMKLQSRALGLNRNGPMAAAARQLR